MNPNLSRSLFSCLMVVFLLQTCCQAGARTGAVQALPDSKLPTALAMPITSVKSRNREIADLIFKDQFIFADFLKEAFTFPGGRIDYDIQIKNAQDSNHLWMQSLTPISHLCNAYELTRDPKYLQRAFPILKDWEDYAARGKNKFLWYDHPVSNRVHTLIYFYVLADSAKLLDDAMKRHLVELLARHCEFLADPANYTQYNHGVMMDKALLLAALFLRPSFPAETRAWQDLALARIRQDFERDFTPSMVHIENSAAYHFYVAKHFEQMVDLLKHFKVEVPADIAERLRKTEDYARLITKPDGQLPLVGDTNNYPSPTTASLASAVHPDAGVAVFAHPAPVRKDSVWMMFKSGYVTPTHKHADDLSFLLYAGGQDVFTDGGLLNYQPDDPYSAYIQGALAHNTLVVDGKSYDLQYRQLVTSSKVRWTLFPQAGLLGHGLSKDLDWVRGFNKSYPGVTLERTLLFLKPDVIVLYDTAASTATHAYSQLFRIAPGLRLARLTDEGFSLAPEKAGPRVSLLQLFPAESGLFDGDAASARGFASFEFNTLVSDPQVEFAIQRPRAEFLTAIGINLDASALRRRLKDSLLVEETQIRVVRAGATLATLPRLK